VEKHIKPALGATPVNRVTTLRLDELYGQLLAAGVGRNTVHKVHLVLNGCLGQAVRWSLIPMNPAEHAQPPKPRAPQTAERTATLDQVRKLYVEAEASDPDFAPCIRLAAATGARRGELAALQWKDVDFEDRSIVIRQAVVRTDGGLILKAPKNGRTRKVAVDDETLRILKKHHAALAERSLKAGTPLSDDAFLFSARPGNAQPLRPETITHRFNKLATEIGAPALTLHGLRHFHVSQLIGAGEDVVTVSARVGHSRPSITTDIYSHVLPERDRQVSDRVGEILSEAL
jgi:integrase